MDSTSAGYATTVAARVASTIAASGRSQARIAEETGIPRVTLIRRLRGGGTAFDVAELHALARVLGVSVNAFTDDAQAVSA